MRIAVLGCGSLGTVLGARALRCGYALDVHDKQRSQAGPLLDAGANWTEHPTELARNADLIFSALPRPADVESVVLGERGMWSAAKPRAIHVETATVGPDCVRRLAERAVAGGLRFLDCPVSRGAADESGVAMVMWVGAHADHYDLARPVLEAVADKVVYCGGVGHGQVTKLVNNLIAHSLTVVLGEALSLGVRSGLSLEVLHAALHEGTAQNRLLDEMLPLSVFRGDWTPGLRLELAAKDLDLAADLARRSGVEIETLDPVRRAFRKAAERGWNDESVHAVVRLAEESFGVSLRSVASIDSPPDRS